MCHRLDIRPVQRDCICLLRESDGAHIDECNQRFRAKFFGAVQGVRAAFREQRADQQLLDALGSDPVMN